MRKNALCYSSHLITISAWHPDLLCCFRAKLLSRSSLSRDHRDTQTWSRPVLFWIWRWSALVVYTSVPRIWEVQAEDGLCPAPALHLGSSTAWACWDGSCNDLEENGKALKMMANLSGQLKGPEGSRSALGLTDHQQHRIELGSSLPLQEPAPFQCRASVTAKVGSSYATSSPSQGTALHSFL